MRRNLISNHSKYTLGRVYSFVFTYKSLSDLLCCVAAKRKVLSTSVVCFASDTFYFTKFVLLGKGLTYGNCNIFNIMCADLLSAFSGEKHYIVGNHDYDGGSNDANFFYAYNMNKNEQIGNAQRQYYYVDNKQQKMRYIVLNPYVPNTSPTTAAFDDEQKTWFSNVALNVESGWGIIILMHYAFDGDTDGAIRTAINDYSGNGEIIAVFYGHLHHDVIKYTTGGTPCIGVTCDKYDATNDTLMNVERTLGTITEHAFDVVIVDRTARKIHCVRIGAPAIDGDGTDTTNHVEIRVIDFKAQTL